MRPAYTFKKSFIFILEDRKIKWLSFEFLLAILSRRCVWESARMHMILIARWHPYHSVTPPLFLFLERWIVVVVAVLLRPAAKRESYESCHEHKLHIKTRKKSFTFLTVTQSNIYISFHYLATYFCTKSEMSKNLSKTSPLAQKKENEHRRTPFESSADALRCLAYEAAAARSNKGGGKGRDRCQRR